MTHHHKTTLETYTLDCWLAGLTLDEALANFRQWHADENELARVVNVWAAADFALYQKGGFLL